MPQEAHGRVGGTSHRDKQSGKQHHQQPMARLAVTLCSETCLKAVDKTTVLQLVGTMGQQHKGIAPGRFLMSLRRKRMATIEQGLLVDPRLPQAVLFLVRFEQRNDTCQHTGRPAITANSIKADAIVGQQAEILLPFVGRVRQGKLRKSGKGLHLCDESGGTQQRAAAAATQAIVQVLYIHICLEIKEVKEVKEVREMKADGTEKGISHNTTHKPASKCLHPATRRVVA